MPLPQNVFRKPLGGAGGYIHWTRLASWTAALLVFFVIGFAFGQGGNDGVSQKAYDAAAKRASDAEKRLDAVLAQRSQDTVQGTPVNNTVPSQEASAPASASPSPTPAASAAPTPKATPSGAPTGPLPAGWTQYTALQNDTLWKIAKRLYGNASLYTAIASANGLTASSPIRAGMVLRIPPKPVPGAAPVPTPSG